MPTAADAPSPHPRLKIILIEDQRMFAEGLSSLLHQQKDLCVRGVYSTIDSALAADQVVGEADIALVDFHLGEGESGPAVIELRRRFPGLRCIWLTGALANASLHRIELLRLEAFVHKDDPIDHLLVAIREVLAGRTYHSPTARRLIEDLRESTLNVPKILSEREQQVLALIGKGWDNQAIGDGLGLSASTVQTHRRNIMGKLNLRTSVALQAYAQQNGYAAVSPVASPVSGAFVARGR